LENPYQDSLTLDQALVPDVMLAYELDGKPLSRAHGAPARVVIPEMYGYKGVKWLSRMELVDRQPTGYWEGLGYDQNAWVGRSNGYHS
jgi:DMSO/TMAO reductase YedYZ molybdopterin-dependent catalytic subunit